MKIYLNFFFILEILLSKNIFPSLIRYHLLHWLTTTKKKTKGSDKKKL